MSQEKVCKKGENAVDLLPNDKIESMCRQQNACESKIKFCNGTSRKHYGKRKKFSLLTFFPFPTTFSKVLLFKIVKSRDGIGKELTSIFSLFQNAFYLFIILANPCKKGK